MAIGCEPHKSFGLVTFESFVAEKGRESHVEELPEVKVDFQVKWLMRQN